MKIYLFLLLILSPFCLPAQDAELGNVEISWESGIITFDVTAPFPDKSILPATRFRVEQKILQQAPKMIVLACRLVILDSWYTVEDRVQEDPDLFRSLEKLTDGLDHSFSRPTEDSRSLTMRFVLPIYPDLANLFFVHEQARTIDPPVGYAPTAEFTGIIILAERPLPERGTDNRVSLNPSVFPRILNEDLTPLSDRDHMEPEFLSRWGTAGYARGYSMQGYEERIGTYPLRIPALEIFGRNRTDLVISRQDAERILVSENNRRLLREGRVVIIYSE